MNIYDYDMNKIIIPADKKPAKVRRCPNVILLTLNRFLLVWIIVAKYSVPYITYSIL